MVESKQGGCAVFFRNAVLMISAVVSDAAAAQIVFEEVAIHSGISNVGSSWGSAWGDFNADGWPDLWATNHSRLPSLYLNNKDGTFTDIANQVLSSEIWTFMENALAGYDAHGAAWADYDNDGDQDLIQLADGGSRKHPNHFYINTNGVEFEAQEKAKELGIDLPKANSRTPLWFDWDNDGLLDLLTTSAVRSGTNNPPATLFKQTRFGFVNLNETVTLGITGASKFGLLSDLTGSGFNDLGISARGAPLHVFEYSKTGVTDQTGSLGLIGTADSVDAISADLSGNGKNEVYVVRGTVGSGVVQVDENTIEASIGSSGDERGFTFQATGGISIDLYPPWQVSVAQVYIGKNGVHPTSRSFQLVSDDPEVQGILVHEPGVDNGFHIGFDSITSTWTILFSSSKPTEPRYIVVRSENPITNVAVAGFDPAAPLPPDSLFVRNTGVYEDVAGLVGIISGSSGRSIAAADLDNDMDVDLYIVATGPVENIPNILYENLGNGVYAPVAAAGGAAGTRLGRGDTVSIADYNLDGFLDLFVTNGKAQHPFDKDGPYQLYRNAGNSNHWFQLDLEGVKSNRDGIGAKVLASAGGVTQLREQNGGMHFRTQNHQRIHFGLGSNTVVDSLRVEWPSGIVQTIADVPADQIVQVLEPSYPLLLGQPNYLAGQEAGVYVWKDSFDGPYHVEVNGDGPLSIFSMELLADQALSSVTPRSLEINDTLAWTANHLVFEGRVTSGIDGVDFQLPAGSRALLGVERNGVANPRQLHIGATGDPLTPAGWLLEADGLSALPVFEAGVDLGLFIGRGSGEVQARWNGDGANHWVELEMLFSQSPQGVVPVSFESNDVWESGVYSVAAAGAVGVWWDGLNVNLSPGTRMGLAYRQDGLVQPHRVNPASRNLGQPNGYWLPQATPYGAPAYDAATEANFFMWQDEGSGRWHVRATAGGGAQRYQGELVSDQPMSGLTARSLEVSDVLASPEPTRIEFDLFMRGAWEDGFEFEVPAGANLQLNLQGGGEPVQAIRIGEQRWPVEQLPVAVGGW